MTHFVSPVIAHPPASTSVTRMVSMLAAETSELWISARCLLLVLRHPTPSPHRSNQKKKAWLLRSVPPTATLWVECICHPRQSLMEKEEQLEGHKQSLGNRIRLHHTPYQSGIWSLSRTVKHSIRIGLFACRRKGIIHDLRLFLIGSTKCHKNFQYLSPPAPHRVDSSRLNMACP